MKGGEDEAVVPGLPEELDVGGVGHAGHGDAVAVFGGRTERFRHLLFTNAPIGGHEGHGAEEERRNGLDEGEARRTHLLQERHAAGLLLEKEHCQTCVKGSNKLRHLVAVR